MKRIRGIQLLGMIFSGVLVLTYTNCGGPITSGPESGGNGSSQISGRQYFDTTVVSMFQSNCQSCHKLPKDGGTAPLTIYNYESMKALLSNGNSSISNGLINRMQGIVSHGGGNVCISGVTQTPCNQAIRWWEAEFGQSTGSRFTGQVTFISRSGLITGWAVDSQNTGIAVQVRIYLGTGTGSGTLVGTVTANSPGSNPSYPGNHGFSFEVPASYNNGTAYTLYAYIVGDGAEHLLAGTPTNYAAYTPRQAGIQYYNSTLGPLLQNSCSGCHTVTHGAMYERLVSPTPANGGTAMNNLLINKAAGMENHGGGTRCSSKNASPCAEMQEWWRREFQ